MKEESFAHLKRIVVRALRQRTRRSPLAIAIWRMACKIGMPQGNDSRQQAQAAHDLAEIIAKKLWPVLHSQRGRSTVAYWDTLRSWADSPRDGS
jgi:hypothetical protein